jgi:TonB family protein
MRCFIFGFLIVLSVATTVAADETTFRQQLYRHLTENSWAFPDKLKSRTAEVDVTLTIDRDGKLLSVEIDHSTGSPEDNENVLTALRRMLPFSRVPDDMPAPFKISAPLRFNGPQLAFQKQLYRHLTENAWIIPEALRNKSIKAGAVFSIDRDGKLLNVAIDQSSGSPEDDAAILAGLRRMQSFPRVPDELPAPYEFKTMYNFGAQPRVGYIDLKWPPMSTTTSGQEIAFHSELLHHLRLFPFILPEGGKKLNDVHSMVDFLIDREGKLLSVKITRSSGLKTVDDQTIAWLKNVQPFPKPPSEIKIPTKLTAEIVFGPKGYDDEARHRVSGVCRGC